MSFHSVVPLAASVLPWIPGKPNFVAVAHPVVERKPLEHPGHGTGAHQSLAHGYHPGAGIERHAIVAVRLGDVAELAGPRFEKPKRHVDERGVVTAGAVARPDDVMGGVALALGIHHLAYEQGEFADLIAFECVLRADVIVEILERLALRLCLGFHSGGDVLVDDDLVAMAGHGGFRLGHDARERVVTLLDRIHREGEIAERTGLKIG
jgi:hypothetical protein